MQNTELKLEVAEPKVEISNSDIVVLTGIPKSSTSNVPEGHKVSALSLSSIRAKRELLENNKGIVKEEVRLPTEAFNDTDMLLQWNKYAQRLSDKGHKIME
ncbi:MAG: hypothetical protein H7199_11695, partial [Burkholderiales bacterium]|nr:hypothetical protein [Flavobacterium sp.]